MDTSDRPLIYRKYCVFETDSKYHLDAAGPRGSGSPFMDDFELDAHSNSADLNFSDLKLAPTPMRREPKVGGSYDEEAWVDRPVFFC